jgi:L-alanine-DL-glutamate epimerase-like enolase superfamily enzyme
VRLEAERFTIRLERPFRIAHGSSLTREAILVHLYDDHEGIVAHGEGALPPYYPSTAQASLRWLDDVAAPGDAAAWQTACTSQGPPEAAAARVALEIALQDLRAQRQRKPLWRLWDLDPARTPPCWMTLSIPASEKELLDLLDEAISRGSKRIKLKTGSGDLGWDETCLRLASERPIRLGLDANGGWTPEQAAKILSCQACRDIVFVEQPVSLEVGWWNELRSRVRAMKTPSLIADESVQTDHDLASLRGLADGVNVKILKAGGLDVARRWITLARSWGLKIMVGTMVETGIGRTAAAQLAPLADWVDIDSPESIPAAPMIGFSMEGDRLVLGDRPGLGLRRV